MTKIWIVQGISAYDVNGCLITFCKSYIQLLNHLVLMSPVSSSRGEVSAGFTSRAPRSCLFFKAVKVLCVFYCLWHFLLRGFSYSKQIFHQSKFPLMVLCKNTVAAKENRKLMASARPFSSIGTRLKRKTTSTTSYIFMV